MKQRYLTQAAILVLLLTLTSQAAADYRIAFGSCLRQWQPQPIWDVILEAKPNAFLFIGDNVYTDAGPSLLHPEPERIGQAYDVLASNAGFQALRAQVPIYATWDDHDYGRNDAGADYPYKEQAKKYFMAFFDIPDDDPMRRHPGIYQAHYLGDGDERIQLLLLDTRSFRSPLKKIEANAACPRVNIAPNLDANATLLGEDQWQWLAEQLREPAALRILVSSIQVIPEQHCFEKWANFPRERDRLFGLIKETRAGGLVIISGDRHLAEISKLPAERIGYPLYEVTASGLNSAGAGRHEQNRYRIATDNFREDHFGLLRLFEEDGEPMLSLHIVESEGANVVSEAIPLDRLKHPVR